MAITATLELAATPPKLTVVSDKRKVEVDVTTAGETAHCSGQFAITVADNSGRVWTKQSDDGVTAVYTS